MLLQPRGRKVPDSQPKVKRNRAAEILAQQRRDYRSAFASESGKRVLADLARLCYLTDSTFSENPYQTAVNEGRRQVMLHIQTIMRLDIDALMALQQRLQDNQEED